MIAGCPGKSTAFAMIVAAASACDADRRQHGHRIGNPERKAAAVPPAGRNAAHGIIGIHPDCPHHAVAIRPVHQADRKMLALAEMQGDVAAIVDIGPIERRCIQHCAENLLRHTAGNCRHRRNETISGIRRDRSVHATRHDALQRCPLRSAAARSSGSSAQSSSRSPVNRSRRSLIGRAHCVGGSPRLDDQINRSILQMQPPAIRQQCDLREPCHARGPGIGFCQGNWRTSSPP